MKKILYVVTGLDVGGAEKQIKQLAIGLKKRGWEGHIISLTPQKAYVDELIDNGISISSLELRRRFPSIRSLIDVLKVIRNYRPRVIISFMFHANIFARVVGRVLKIPFIITSIRTEHFGGYHRYLIEKYFSNFSNLIVVNSNNVAQALINKRIIKSNKLAVIYNGIYEDRSRISVNEKNELRNNLEIGKDDYLWLTVGRLEERKNHKLLLKAFHILLKRREAYLVIAGSGALEDELKMLANKLGINNRVRFLGMRNDVPLLLSVADSFVLSSKWEGMPNAIMEALCAELPVVSTDVGGVSELIINGITGYLAKKNSKKQLAEVMISVMDMESSKRKKMGERGRELVLNRYLMDDIINLWENTLLNLIEDKERKSF